LGGTIGSWKLQTGQLNLFDLQINGARCSRYLRQVWEMMVNMVLIQSTDG